MLDEKGVCVCVCVRKNNVGVEEGDMEEGGFDGCQASILRANHRPSVRRIPLPPSTRSRYGLIMLDLITYCVRSMPVRIRQISFPRQARVLHCMP